MHRRVAALIAADAAVLVTLRPRQELIHDLVEPHAWLASAGADAAAVQLASAALWVVAVWLAVGLSAAAGSALPGVVGRSARRLAEVVLPHALYRFAAGAAGKGVLLSPAAAGAAPFPSRAVAAASAMTASPALVGSVPAVLSPPGSDLPATAFPAVSPAPAWPTDDVLPPPDWPSSRRVHPGPHTAPSADRAEPAVRRGRAGSAPVEHASGIIVRPGDSLWHIAAARLPRRASNRRIAAAWPHWYAANRGVIGGDPDHIVPGQLLHAPVEEDRT